MEKKQGKQYIKTAKDAHKAVGKQVAWVDGTGLVWRECSGTLESVRGKNVLIDGDWKWRPDIIGLHVKPE